MSENNEVFLLYKKGNPDVCEWLDAIAETILKQGFRNWSYKYRLDDHEPCMACGSYDIYRYSSEDGSNTVDRCEHCGIVLDSDFTPPPEVEDILNEMSEEDWADDA